MSATQVQFRRGTDAQNNSFTGADGEITIDTTNHQIRVHDGSTPGGFAAPAVTPTGNLTVTGNITAAYFVGNGAALTGLPAGYANSDAVAYAESGWAGNIIPSANITYDLGNATNRWNDIWLANSTIYLGEVSISASGGNLVLPANTEISGSSSFSLPVGNTAQRPEVATAGMIRYNSTAGEPEWYDATGNVWQDFDTKTSYASFYYAVNDAAGSITIASTATFGVTMLFNCLGPSQNITANTTTSTWQHAYPGTYRVFTAFRQATGGDVWTVLAVTKNGNANAVGVSARTGSEDSHNENYTIVYTVDDTTATYQLQHWCGSGSKTVLSDFSQGNPGWGNYSALCGNTTGDIGRMVDYYVERLGD